MKNQYRPHGRCFLCERNGKDCHCSQDRVRLADVIQRALIRHRGELAVLYRELAKTQ